MKMVCKDSSLWSRVYRFSKQNSEVPLSPLPRWRQNMRTNQSNETFFDVSYMKGHVDFFLFYFNWTWIIILSLSRLETTNLMGGHTDTSIIRGLYNELNWPEQAWFQTGEIKTVFRLKNRMQRHDTNRKICIYSQYFDTRLPVLIL